MEGRLGISRKWWRAVDNARMVWNQKQDHGQRFITLKASNRAAVHGVKRPTNEKIDEEEVEQEIKKGKEGKEEKESKRKEREKDQLPSKELSRL
ncbi:hypothetical protein CRYUN_Cryun34aG0056200 [Craigia yunnanensis]